MNKIFNHIHIIDSDLHYCGCGCGLWWSRTIREFFMKGRIETEMERVITTRNLP